MENGFVDLGAMAPVFLLFLTSGLIIFAVSSWVGEALLGQIRESKTSIFGRADGYSKNKGRAMYVPPAQLTTANQKVTVEQAHSLPAIPNLPSFKS